MQNVTDRTSNPFGMSPPCEHRCSAGVEAVYGYGDANADIHVVGDHPGVHGGSATGVPFSGIEAGLAMQDILDAVDLLDDPGDEPTLESTFLSYLHMCCPATGETPSPAAYTDLERFFDAELRAIAAHVLIPVGERATAHVLKHYTAESLADLSTNGTAESIGFEEEAEATPLDMERLHATEIKGSGWLVVPIRDPGDWAAGDRDAAIEAITELLARDYRQISAASSRVTTRIWCAELPICLRDSTTG